MSLSARLSAFFLTALALVLGGFSAGLYLLAHGYLHQQVNGRLAGALDTLSAAAEIQPDGVEWEPHEHHLVLGQDPAPDQVRWLVRDDRGRVIDRSANLGGADLAVTDAGSASEDRPGEGGPWRLVQRRLLPRPGSRPTAASPEPGIRYAALVLTAGLSLRGVDETLRNLALTLVGLSVVLWFGAALLGRWAGRRALRPVRDMAAAARAMGPGDAGGRLPSPGTGDELEALGGAFNDLLTRLHEAFARQQRFTGDASHQLRTPLTALIGQIEVALRRPRAADEYHAVLAQVQGQAGQLRQIVDMLLFLARADADARAPLLEPIDLARWLPAHLETWAGHPRAGDLRVEVAAEGPLVVRAQPPLLGQLCDNLLDNACKYSPRGTPVVLRLDRGESGVLLSVEDGGVGIGPEDLPHVFEPFYRSAQARRAGTPGVGLGLSVVQRIAQALGGTIRVSSELGKGTRFVVRLSEPEASATAHAGPSLTLPAQTGMADSPD
jgi:heavy metal sensor kinase